ncbi:putative bifunctional diguanylate cyclase/phosphodiesterase [Amphiplicatus metriothermophilus]|uniref:Diguanylate cyclase/phosphodiesterase n=1 Tax=Amphiplicatus metriothermophilus TaxID=1519374 RepID=A0A239PIV6_9PROT|nr:bifunctional diguanylate cyclase/phosphodiesterase [Amphiplicatus metriothermophilus]MBB5517925.1 diguanylate cyclase (GGDEF)-like protein [Amphiplicatus metriothermophilus]SNT67742.1 diguanylate cyclase/phosphodiesterase [Amphiplicatus metriothermophilus]
MPFSVNARLKAAGENVEADAARRDRAGGGDMDDGAGDATLQALFEFDPVADRLRWADPGAAARLLGRAAAPPASAREEYEALILSGDVAERAAAFAGDAASYVCQIQLRREDGERHWVEERGGWIGAGENRRLIGVVRSIEAQKRREERLAWLAHNDELTGLLNRPHLRRRIDAWLAAAKASGRKGAYLLAGIDDLGAVNADFGFEAADEVIVEIAGRLASVLGPDDQIGRVAGTKFGILIVDACEEALRETCIKLMNVVRESVIDTRRGGVAASICIGAAALPADAQDSQTVMAWAEAALDQAKRLGRSSWSAFTEKTDTVSMRRRNTHMSDVILTALNERRVRLAFQPIVSDLGEAPAKFECLIRMRGEDGREIGAPDFIPAAERLGLVHLLDRRVLELATNTLAVCPHIQLTVNVSMETVKDPVWAEGYLAHLRANPALAKRITVELTETQVIDAIDASIEFVSEVKKLGSSFAIDDFGAGYTSFRNLKALDIDILKIDGSFVTGVASSSENQLFVRTLLDLARNFGMKTVAEWVDNEADAMLLKGLGVDYLQGFLIGKPEINPSWLPSGAPNEPPAQTQKLGAGGWAR